MSNARFSILQARAVEDKRISNAQFRTLAALGMYGDKDGWCFPKLKTLAQTLGKSKQAVSKDLIELQALGYIEIKHQYRDDGGLQNSLFRIIFDNPAPRQPDVDTPSTPEIDTPSTPEVDTLSTSEVDALTPQSNAPSNAPEVVEDQPLPNIYRVYENEIGNLTPMLADMLDDINKTYPGGWFELAVKEAKRSTTRVTLKYVEAILKRWKADGKGPLLPKTRDPQPAEPVEIDLPAYIGGD